MPPRNPFQVLPLPLGGSLNTVDSAQQMPEADVVLIENFEMAGLGRMRTRRPMQQLGELKPPDTAGVQKYVAGVFPFPAGVQTDGSRVVGVRVDWHRKPPANLSEPASGALHLWTLAVPKDPVANPGRYKAEYVGVLAKSDTFLGEFPDLTAYSMAGKLWFCVGSKQAPVSYYDPFPATAGEYLYAPEYSFTKADGTTAGDATTKSPMFCRVGAVYNNHLLLAGYGTELDKNRPEIIRFSYLGMDPSNRVEPAGDAGYYKAEVKDDPNTATNEAQPAVGDVRNSGKFDLEDYFMLSPDRGVPVVSMAPAAGRLVIASARAVYTLWGYNHESFKVELLDNARGSVATRGMVEADGVVYWWSPLGPCRWGGGQVEDLGYKIQERVRQVDSVHLFAVHVPARGEVRWYYREKGVGGFPTRALCFSYRLGTWTEHVLGGGSIVTCGGALPPQDVNFEGSGTISKPPPEPTGYQGSGPSGLDVNMDAMSWTNGDTSSGVKTVIARCPGTTLTGTIATTAGSAIVTGTETLFLTELAVADLVGNPQTGMLTVQSIESNTQFTATAAAPYTYAATKLGTYMKHHTTRYQLMDGAWSDYTEVASGVATYGYAHPVHEPWFWSVRHRKDGLYSSRSNDYLLFPVYSPNNFKGEYYSGTQIDLSWTNRYTTSQTMLQYTAGYAASGTVAVSGNQVTGTGTSFLTELKVGMAVRVGVSMADGGFLAVIQSIESATAATLDRNVYVADTGRTLHYLPDTAGWSTIHSGLSASVTTHRWTYPSPGTAYFIRAQHTLAGGISDPVYVASV